MARKKVDIRDIVFLDDCSHIKLEDPEPDGYMERYQWAQMQMRAKRRQFRCEHCSGWWWPHTGVCKSCERIKETPQ